MGGHLQRTPVTCDCDAVTMQRAVCSRLRRLPAENLSAML
jgi:hypothetical protein